jgi:hypothetical protein
LCTHKPKLAQIQFIDKRIDDSDRIILMNVVIQSFWEQGALGSAFTGDVA